MSGTTYFVGIATLAALIAAYVYQKKKKEHIPLNWDEVGFLKKVDIYPLKSGHRIELQTAEVTEFGLKQSKGDGKVFQLGDRCLVVYTEKDKEFRTARTYPKMVLIDVANHDIDHLSIDAPSMRTLYVKIPTSDKADKSTIKLHRGESISTLDCGDEAAVWFSRYILDKDSGLRLGYHDGSEKRDITRSHKKLVDFYKNLSNYSTGLYSDLTSLLLINQASVDDLNEKINNATVTVNNFRPNLVVDGPNLEAYSEDHWEWIKIGDVVMRNVKECTRCIMTTIDQTNAVRNTNREPLKTLETYRNSNGPEKLPIMGIHLEVKTTGIVAIGDKVFVSRGIKN